MFWRSKGFLPTSGSMTLEPDTSLECRQGVTMLAIARDPEHQGLTCGYSSFVVRIKSACYPRNTRDVSAVCTIKEAKWKPIRLS